MINPRVSSLNKSSTLKITALTKKLRKEGKDVVNFAAGEPDFDTPPFIKEAAKKAIEEGFTKYTPSEGTIELRNQIALKLRQDNKLPVTDKNIIVTSGAKYAIFVAISLLVKEKEEVIIPAPYWVSYPEMVKLCGAKTKILPTEQKDNFKININRLEEILGPKTKLLILNYPANPTGITYSEQELQKIFNVIKDRNIFVLSDEIYEKLLYDGRQHVSFASLPGTFQYTLTVNGFSKSFSMTGWRLGYLIGEESLISEAAKIIDHTTSCACSISQKAAQAALEHSEWQEEMKAEFEKRRNLLWQGLNSCGKIKPLKSEGTFYMFCDISRTGLTAMDFCSQLLEEQLVSCIPAESFGAEGFIRISFATSPEDICKGIERIKLFLNKF